jgi:hypothetical protein
MGIILKGLSLLVSSRRGISKENTALRRAKNKHAGFENWKCHFLFVCNMKVPSSFRGLPGAGATNILGYAEHSLLLFDGLGQSNVTIRIDASTIDSHQSAFGR